MSHTDRRRAVIDCDITYSRVLHDLMGRIAARFELLVLLELQASTWAGGRPVAELLDALERAGAEAFADAARRLVSG